MSGRGRRAIDIGARAEDDARRHLEREGLEVIATNYRCRHGEIDIVMRDGDTLVFVEVRYRRSARFGSGAETIDPRKRARIVSAARHFLQRHPRHARAPCRFDVVSMSAGNGAHAHDWIRGAFET